jgi:hypothetical protein
MSTGSKLKFPLANLTPCRLERRYTRNELVPPDDDHPDAETFIAAVRPPGPGWFVFAQSNDLTGWARLADDDGGAS